MMHIQVLTIGIRAIVIIKIGIGAEIHAQSTAFINLYSHRDRGGRKEEFKSIRSSQFTISGATEIAEIASENRHHFMSMEFF